jgi:hypothetical protein
LINEVEVVYPREPPTPGPENILKMRKFPPNAQF